MTDAAASDAAFWWSLVQPNRSTTDLLCRHPAAASSQGRNRNRDWRCSTLRHKHMFDQMAVGIFSFIGWLAQGTACLCPTTSHAPCVTAVLVGGLFYTFEICGFSLPTFLETTMPVSEKCLGGFRLQSIGLRSYLNAGCFHLRFCMFMEIFVFG